MELLPVIIYISTLVAMTSLMFIIGKHEWVSSNIKFAIKKILDCFVSLFFYMYIVVLHELILTYEILNDIKYWFIIMGAIFVISSIGISINQFKDFHKNREIYFAVDKKSSVCSVFSVFFIMLFGFSALNYIIYIVFPFSYNNPSQLTQGELGFEFIYYTFNLMFTYNGETISAASIFTKIVQMIENISFFIFVGVILSGFIGKIPDNRSNALRKIAKEVIREFDGNEDSNP